MRGVAALIAVVGISTGMAAADPAHDLFTGQDKTAADGRIARFACHNCHGRDGRGGVEGDVPEIAGQALRAPTDLRPAYDFTSFRNALTAGVDPSGRGLSRIMPRYDVTDAELALLWDYLQDLPNRQAMGVTPGHVRFGVVIDPAYPEIGRRYLGSFRAELAAQFPSGSVYGRRIEVVALRDPVMQAQEVIAALALPAGQGELAGQLTAVGLPVIFPLTALNGTEDASVQRGLVPTQRDINGAIAAHLATTAARRIGISADPARTDALSHMIRLEIPDATVGPVSARGEALDAVIDLDGNLPRGMADPLILYRLASQAQGPVHAPHSFLVIEAPGLIALAIDEGLHPLEAHAALSARILSKALKQAGRDLSRSRLLSVLEETDLGPEHLDYASLPLSGSQYVSIIADLTAQER